MENLQFSPRASSLVARHWADRLSPLSVGLFFSLKVSNSFPRAGCKAVERLNVSKYT